MRRMRCKCGTEHFKVHPKQGMVQCLQCGQRFEWKGEWKAMVMSRPRQIVRAVREAAGISFDWMQAKVIHPKKEKNLLMPLFPKVASKKFRSIAEIQRTKSPDIEKRIRARWKSEINCLEAGHDLVFSKHNHKGSLRGVHIARACHSDLARIGVKTNLRLKDQTGYVEAV